jgi:phosphatidylglycerophosphate synthase
VAAVRGCHFGDDADLAWRRFSPRPLTSGERWTARELEALRGRRYAPRAWLAFVSHSLERARETARARPALARQSRRWGLYGAAGWLASCKTAKLTGRTGIELRPLPGLAWWLAVWQMLHWHLGEAEGGNGVPRDRLGRANAVTLTRFWLVPILYGTRRTSVGLAVVIAAGGLTDALDGHLARRDGRTRLGRDLDTFADLVFVCTATFAAYRGERVSPLAASALAVRYSLGLAIATTAVFKHARRPAIRARPSGAALRFGGLALATAGARRAGSALLLAGSLTPPVRISPPQA